MLNPDDLKGKIAVVTGGSTGIGQALAQGLAQSGARVVIVNRNAENGKAAAKKIVDQGLDAVSIPADLSRKEGVEKMAGEVLSRFDRIDILVNNAGTGVRKSALDLTEEDLDHIFDLNFKAVFRCCKIVGRKMIDQGGGKIVNVSSLAKHFTAMNRSGYSASKAAVSQYTRTLALEWAKYGVYVNDICPGIIRTPLTGAYIDSDENRMKVVLGKIPLKRLGRPEDMVGAVLFLASSASDYMTGQSLIIDGGYSLGCMDW